MNRVRNGRPGIISRVALGIICVIVVAVALLVSLYVREHGERKRLAVALEGSQEALKKAQDSINQLTELLKASDAKLKDFESELIRARIPKNEFSKPGGR